YLKRHKTVAISDIDTRKLTRLLRKTGVQNGCILTGNNLNPHSALEKIKLFGGIKGLDLARKVTTKNIYSWRNNSCDFGINKLSIINTSIQLLYHVVAYDFGVKRNILRLLVDRGC
ncbi:MAG: carbamoyl-phosphate synthase domain-containing protein, partial [Arsenophonus sp. ET-DL12-MAG3]